MTDQRKQDANYVLGTSKQEQARLKKQGDAVAPITERLLREAGIGPGMRVLDIGCGIGDVALIAADLVGSDGEVVGIDREPKLLATARTRFEDLGKSNVSFVEGDFREAENRPGTFDAVVGRLVLMYQADPADAIRQTVQSVRPDGSVAFLEYDSTVAPASLEPLPLHLKMRSWIWGVLDRSGAETQMGLRMYKTFIDAGLPGPTMFAEGIIQTATQRYPAVPLVRVLLPRIVEYGLGTEEDVGIDTLEERLQVELSEADTPYLGQIVYGAWTKVLA